MEKATDDSRKKHLRQYLREGDKISTSFGVVVFRGRDGGRIKIMIDNRIEARINENEFWADFAL